MNTYTVRVSSSGISADWDDDVIVIAPNTDIACEHAERYIRGAFPQRDIQASTALGLTVTRARAIGRLANDGE
jgi:hypothetical protein